MAPVKAVAKVYPGETIGKPREFHEPLGGAAANQTAPTVVMNHHGGVSLRHGPARQNPMDTPIMMKTQLRGRSGIGSIKTRPILLLQDRDQSPPFPPTSLPPVARRIGKPDRRDPRRSIPASSHHF